jgi:hypothetical protein
MRLCASFVLGRDRTARPTNALNGAFVAWGLLPAALTSCAAVTPRSMARLSYTLASLRPPEADVARPGLPRPAGPAFRAAKLSINAEIPGSGTTTR